MDPLVLSGSASQALASKIAGALDSELGDARVERFPDGELQVEVGRNVRQRSVYVVQATAAPVADNLLELFFLADACRHAGALRVAAVMPYFGYARQDRRARTGRSLGARVVARLLGGGRFDRCLVVDLHSPPVEGCFDVPVTQLSALPVLAAAVASGLDAGGVVVAPDVGAAKRAEAFARALKLPLALVHKTRLSGTEVAAAGVVGDVRKREAVLIDDMISTGATVEAAVGALREAGFSGSLTVAATHGLFTGRAGPRLARLGLRRLILTDTVAPASDAPALTQVVSVAPAIAAAIRQIEGVD